MTFAYLFNRIVWCAQSAPLTDINRVEKDICQKFGDVIDQEGIMVSWDNWSGIFIIQMPGMNTDSSDAVIREIYKFLASEDAD